MGGDEARQGLDLDGPPAVRFAAEDQRQHRGRGRVERGSQRRVALAPGLREIDEEVEPDGARGALLDPFEEAGHPPARPGPGPFHGEARVVNRDDDDVLAREPLMPPQAELEVVEAVFVGGEVVGAEEEKRDGGGDQRRDEDERGAGPAARRGRIRAAGQA